MPASRVGIFESNQVWQQAREPVFWLDSSLNLAWVNPAWERLTGYSAESVIGMACHAHGPTRAGDAGDLAASLYPPAEALAGQPAAMPSLILHSSGERLWRRIEFWPFCALDASLIGVLGLVRPMECQQTAPDSEAGQLHVQLLDLRRRLHEQYGFDSLIGRGPAHHRLLDQVRLAAHSTLPILIFGETGTGKRHIARTIHQNGPSRHQPLFTLDCEALPPEVFERELFGAASDAATGNEPSSRAGSGARQRLPLEDGATVLIREIFRMPRDLQARLITSLCASVRLLATTTLDPDAAVESDQVRPELYFALTTLVLRVPPLRERRDELPALAQHFLERANERGAPQRTGFSPQAISALTSYDWPGNLRELARVVDYAHDHPQIDGPIVDLTDLPASIRGNLAGAYQPRSRAQSGQAA